MENQKMRLLRPIRDLEEEANSINLKTYKNMSERIYKAIKKKNLI